MASSYVPVRGDYVFLDGEWREITFVRWHGYTLRFSIKRGCEYVLNDWMKFVPADEFNSPLYQALL